MIHFKKVRWKNFLSTGNQFTEVLLDRSPTTLIIGENGSGKSTMLDALCFGLFGKAYRPIKKNQLVNSINTSGAVVEVEFEIGKNKFKVVRSIKPNDFQIIRNGEAMDQEAHSRDFQKILEDSILKLNYKSFTQVVILGSSCFIPFMQLSTNHRREIVEDILDIKIFSTMNMLLKQNYKTISGEMGELELEENLYRSKQELEETHLGKIEQDAEKRIGVLEKERDKYNVDKNQRMERNLEIQTALVNKTSVEANSSKLSTLRTQVKTKKSEVDKQRDFFVKNDDCPVCEQPIKQSFKKLRNKELLDQSQKYESAIGEMESELNRLNSNISELNMLSSELQQNNAEIKALTSMAEKCQKDLDQLSKDKKETDEIRSHIEDLKSNIQEIDLRMKELKEENFYLDICKNLLHDTGIKSKIIKQYLPVMNQTIQKYLSILDFYVNFHLNEQFEETIKSRYRDDFSYSSFSEGEKMRIDLALMFTWREIARLKNSTNTNLLIMDEVFDSSLDASGTDDFLKILNELESQNIFVISHKGDVLFDKFYSMIKFEKQNNFSKMVDA
mgnify:CR=1 FL=1|tara:strand:+ start:484 stop:2157 length:1674 start_codon:yes stop_codon:yes gene_type:complete